MENADAAVARSTFASQNPKKLTCSGDFWKFRCGNIARCCREKHICMSKCTKYLRFGAPLKLLMSKMSKKEEIDRKIDR